MKNLSKFKPGDRRLVDYMQQIGFSESRILEILASVGIIDIDDKFGGLNFYSMGPWLRSLARGDYDGECAMVSLDDRPFSPEAWAIVFNYSFDGQSVLEIIQKCKGNQIKIIDELKLRINKGSVERRSYASEGSWEVNLKNILAKQCILHSGEIASKITVDRTIGLIMQLLTGNNKFDAIVNQEVVTYAIKFANNSSILLPKIIHRDIRKAGIIESDNSMHPTIKAVLLALSEADHLEDQFDVKQLVDPVVKTIPRL